MLYLILLPLLISAVIIPLLGERKNISWLISLSAAVFSFLLSIFFFILYFNKNIIESYTWFSFSNFSFSLSLIGNNLTLFMTLLVSFISIMVLMFAGVYMKKERHARFYAEMSFFIFSMLGLVMSNSLLLFFIFWEFVGITSYLLIGFWYDRAGPANSSKKALLITRIGDLAFLAALIVVFSALKTFSISSILDSIHSMPLMALAIAGSLFTIAGLSKAAQFPFYTWLIDAMEGPTPVSSLLHSATMVAAGAYLLVRLLPLISAAGLLNLIVVIGFITAFAGALLGLKERHFKKILAYSTIESLAFMFLAIGTLNAGGAIFYLFTHAVFKSMLFFISGGLAIIFGTYDVYELNKKKLRGNWFTIPALIGFASISAIPPFMSFFAHSAITHNFNVFENIAFVFVAFITALFSFRAFFVIFGSKTKKPLKKEFNLFFPIILLSIISTVGGVFLYFFNGIISIVYSFDVFSFIALAASLLGVFVSYEIFYLGKTRQLTEKMKSLSEKIAGYGYEKFIIAIGNSISTFGFYVGKFDFMFSNAMSRIAESTFILSSKTREIENGDAFRYITAVVIGLAAILLLAVIFI
ncbi:MAG: proton-conducting transporter membrane subunit [Candidatus Parvarchaeota archaeon]|nr:proton-conducting transporter membrane subunit [Candidatus Parvarchaeum tengchongense]MCW1298971.1 proton-conducting transporter membrane subunit [Candidatus Parvarchaeum tengchongense]MCW1312214.1 proton-conducting transporter membrane subunit [Candidatus Parvarchaeum tengchongense]